MDRLSVSSSDGQLSSHAEPNLQPDIHTVLGLCPEESASVIRFKKKDRSLM